MKQKVQRARWESEQWFHLLVQNVTDYAIMMLDTEGRVAAWNEGAARIKQYAEKEILGRHVSVFYPPEELAAGRPGEELAAARETGRSEVEGFRLRKDGSRFWVNEIMTAVRDDAGKLVGYAKISRDLTERKAMQDALSRSEARYRQVVEGVRDYAIFSTDASGNVTHWNRAAREILGYEEAEIIGQSGDVIFTPEDRANGAPGLERRQAEEQGRGEDERWHVRKDGSRFWGSGIMTAVRDGEGRVVGYFKILRDRTDRKQREDEKSALLASEHAARREAEAARAEAETARETAEAATRLKDEFLAVASHELRTPLASILLWSNLLKEGRLDEKARAAAVENLQQSADAQQRLIDDLLDAARLTSGNMHLRARPTDLAAVAASAVAAVRPAADAKGVRVGLSFDPALGKVRADGDRLRQVLWNLLTNAVKFSDKGADVRVRLQRLGEEVRIAVSDTGRGISPAFLPYVFDRFRQEDPSSTRKEGGLGLGLAIARQLVELHGGTITAESGDGDGKGATFIVRLPLPPVTAGRKAGGKGHGKTGRGEPKATRLRGGAAVTAGRAAPVPPAILEGVRVLLVEDEAAMRGAVGLVLEQAGAHVTAVPSAAQALAALEASDGADGPHVLLSDVGMAEVDGYELVRKVRALEARRGHPPLPALALTAYARVQDRQRAMEAGFQRHLPKPVVPADEVRAVAALAGKV